MTAQEYIQLKLEELKQPLEIKKPENDEQLIEQIVRAVTSKKFRKYHISPENIEHLKSSITLNIKNKQPIQATLVFGGYKIWRLEETPEVDWAELFSLMYYTKWMKPICEVYEPGVWFDFYSDDVIVPVLNNVPAEDTLAYRRSFERLLDFLRPFQPQNLSMTYNRVGDQYKSPEDFKADLEMQKRALDTTLNGKLPTLSDDAKRTLDLNVKLNQEQKDDPEWREKVQFLHDAYAQVTQRRPYYRTPDKFNIMTTPFNGMLSVGTTKDSVMKFWAGTGVLKPSKDNYRQLVMSPNQVNDAPFDWELVSIPNLQGKNFSKIRVLN